MHKLHILLNRLTVFGRSTIGERILKGISWSFIGVGFSKIFVLLASYACAHSIGQTSFGMLGVIQSTIQMLGTVAGLGLSTTATKYLAEYRNDSRRSSSIISLVLFFGLISSLIFSFLLYIFSPQIALYILKDAALAKLLRISILLLFFSIMVGVQNGILTGFESFKTIAIRSIIASIFSLLFMTIGVQLFRIDGAILALGLTQIVNYFLNDLVIRRQIKRNGIEVRISLVWKEIRIIPAFALPAMLANSLVSPATWFCNMVLANSQNGFYEMGLFNAANQWNGAVMFLPSTISTIVLPILSNIDNSNKNDYRKVLKANLLANVAISVVVVMFVSLGAGVIMGGYGKGFKAGTPVLRVLVLSCIFNSANAVIGQAIASKNRMWIGFIFNALWALALVLFSCFFVQNGMGALSLSFAYLFAYMLHTVWQLFYLRHVLKS